MMTGMSEAHGGEGFYAAALTEAERLLLPSARVVEGVDEEMAALRSRLFSMLREKQERLDMLSRGIGSLVRMAALRYWMSPQSEEDLAGSLAGLVNSFGAALGLGEYRDAAEG